MRIKDVLKFYILSFTKLIKSHRVWNHHGLYMLPEPIPDGISIKQVFNRIERRTRAENVANVFLLEITSLFLNLVMRHIFFFSKSSIPFIRCMKKVLILQKLQLRHNVKNADFSTPLSISGTTRNLIELNRGRANFHSFLPFIDCNASFDCESVEE